MTGDDDDAADRAFERRARAELRRGIDETPADVRAQLDRIVERALTQPSSPRLVRFTLPAGAVAILAVILIAQPWRATEVTTTPAAEDFALLINGDDLDLLEQMEFYQWLDRQPGILDEIAASGSAQRS
jgi:hypothetical protein